jgi:hypothetical protein
MFRGCRGRANCANGPMSIERLNPTPRRADWDKGGANAAPISRSYAVACCNRRLRQADFAPKLLTVWKIKDEDLLAALHVRNPKLITCKLLLGRTGQPFWQDESYDHYARNSIERDRIIAYIEENPVSAGLIGSADLWPWSSAGWQAKPPAPPDLPADTNLETP